MSYLIKPLLVVSIPHINDAITASGGKCSITAMHFIGNHKTIKEPTKNTDK